MKILPRSMISAECLPWCASQVECTLRSSRHAGRVGQRGSGATLGTHVIRVAPAVTGSCGRRQRRSPKDWVHFYHSHGRNVTVRCPVCGSELAWVATLTSSAAFPWTCPRCGSHLARQPSVALRLLFSVLYNVIFWAGILLGLAFRSWWPVVILCPTGAFLLPKVLAWLSPIMVVSPWQVHRARRANLLFLALFVLLVLFFGLNGQT